MADQRSLRLYEHKPVPKKVILMGMGPSCVNYLQHTLTQELTPDFCDEVWVINMAANCFHHDLVFWMDDLKQQQEFKPGLIELLRQRGKPVISCTSYPEIVPDSYDFPLNDVASIGVPIFGKPYLNNGVAMAIGYAMHIGVENLAIYGADFSYPNRDYAESGRACVEAWLTIAAIRNMNIVLPPDTSLLDTVKDHGIYGYAEQPEIVLPDGKVFKYEKVSKDMGKYRPEDSRNETNVDIPEHVSERAGEAPSDWRPGGSKPNGAAQAPAYQSAGRHPGI